MSKNKWKILPDDLNPRHSKIRYPKPVRTLKSWTLTAQIVIEMEHKPPTTPRMLLETLLTKRVISDPSNGLQSIKRAMRELQRFGIVVADRSKMSEASAYDGMAENTYTLNPEAKYIFK